MLNKNNCFKLFLRKLKVQIINVQYKHKETHWVSYYCRTIVFYCELYILLVNDFGIASVEAIISRWSSFIRHHRHMGSQFECYCHNVLCPVYLIQPMVSRMSVYLNCYKFLLYMMWNLNVC